MKMLIASIAVVSASAAFADTTIDYDVVFAGKKMGTQELVITDRGIVHVSYTYRDNGRGPDIEEEITLLPDGTFKSYRQTGRNTYGAILDERFAWSSGRASWQSPADRGKQAVTGPALYLPTYGSPETSAILVRATQKAGASLPALPGGELRSEKLAQLRVGGANRERDVILYALFGIGLQPEYVWMESGDPMSLFASIVGSRQLVAAGYQDVTAELARVQQEAEAAWFADIAKKQAQPLAQPSLIKNVHIFDGKTKSLGDPADVYLNDGRIAAIYPAGFPAQAPATVIDGAGRALLPGLIDMHTHEDPMNSALQIAGGVTTSRDMGNDNARLAKLRDDIAAGRTI